MVKSLNSEEIFLFKQAPPVPSRENRPKLSSLQPNYSPPPPPKEETIGRVDHISMKAGIKEEAPFFTNTFVVGQAPLPTPESEAIKETNEEAKKTKKGIIKRFFSFFHKKKKTENASKKSSNVFSKLFQALRFKKKDVRVQPAETLISKENISVEFYHKLLKELISLIDNMPAITDSNSTTTSIFRGSANETVLNAFEKKFYANPQAAELPQEIVSNVDTMAGMVKRIVFRDMPVDRFRALGLDSAFASTHAERSDQEIIGDLKEKLNSLSPQDKEFLRDLIVAIDLAYRKSWQQRLDANLETMIISVPTIARFFNSNLTMDSNPLNPAALVTWEVQQLIFFMIQHQEELFI